MKKLLFLTVCTIFIVLQSCQREAVTKPDLSSSHMLQKSSSVVPVAVPEQKFENKDQYYEYLTSAVSNTLYNGNVNAGTVNIGYFENQEVILTMDEETISTIKTILMNIISENFNVSKDEIIPQDCIECLKFYNNFQSADGLYLIYNKQKSITGQILEPEKQLLFLDFPFFLARDPKTKRNISLVINPSSEINKIETDLGITITTECVAAVGETVCGCCTYYYPHWWSLARECDCHLGNGTSCQKGMCYLKVTASVNIGT